jgi:hypothetical protein
VSKMRRVVHRHTADVHPHLPWGERKKFFFFVAECVENFYGHRILNLLLFGIVTRLESNSCGDLAKGSEKA